MTPEEVDDRINDWHESDSDLRLHEYLGWTWEEYCVWVETDVIPE